MTPGDFLRMATDTYLATEWPVGVDAHRAVNGKWGTMLQSVTAFVRTSVHHDIAVDEAEQHADLIRRAAKELLSPGSSVKWYTGHQTTGSGNVNESRVAEFLPLEWWLVEFIGGLLDDGLTNPWQ